MNNLKLKIILILITSCFYFLASDIPAHAQNVSLGIYPPIMQADVTAPADPKADIYLENQSDQSVDINIAYKAFQAANSLDGQIEILDNTSAFPDPLFFYRIKILDGNQSIKSLTLSPKQNKKLTIEMPIPANQAKGDYYFTVLFTSSPSNSIISNSSEQSLGVAMNVLLSVGPKGKTQGYIQQFSAPLFVNNGPIPFSLALQNTSDHFITPKGEIIIKNLFGQNVGKVTLMPVNILANSTRQIPDLLQADVNSKDYAVIQSIVEKNALPVAVWPEKFLIGPYTANLTLSLSDSGPTFTKSLLFFAFPLTYLIAIILIFIITIFIILRVKRKMI